MSAGKSLSRKSHGYRDGSWKSILEKFRDGYSVDGRSKRRNIAAFSQYSPTQCERAASIYAAIALVTGSDYVFAIRQNNEVVADYSRILERWNNCFGIVPLLKSFDSDVNVRPVLK